MTNTRPPLHIEPLRTGRLDLTPLDPARDAPDLHAMLADPEVHRYDTDARASRSVAETERRLRLQVMANDGTTWAVRLHGGPAIGTIGIFADQGTRVRGVGWSLASAHWRGGIMSEAARAAIPYLLAQDGVDGLEAWVDSRNLGSLGVARAVGMTVGGRLPLSCPDGSAQTVVMVRAAVVEDPEVFGTFSTLVVSDLPSTLTLLQSVFRLHVAWAFPDPPSVAFLAVEPWSGSHGFQVEQVAGTIIPGALSVDVGVSVDTVRRRVADAGLVVVDEPADKPWSRREMVFRLPDGHLIRVIGPFPPAR